MKIIESFDPPRFPVISQDSLTAPFWEKLHQGVFALPTCEDCGQRHFYPQGVCPHCDGARLTWTMASGNGIVYSYSIVHRAPSPTFAEDVPYVIAIIKTTEGPHLMSRVIGIDPQQVRVGMPVQVVFKRVTEQFTLPLFEPTHCEA